MKHLDQNVVLLYQSGLTLRQIAEQYNTNHHKVKRFLIKHGITIEKRYRSNVTTESRKRMSKSAIARGDNFDHKPNPDVVRRMRTTKLRSTRDLSIYDDTEKLQFLIRYTSKHKILYSAETTSERDIQRFKFIDNFYYDPQLNLIWNRWKENGECKWWRPSLDHKIPISRGGTFDLENLHFLTWFENRAKADMTEMEWMDFKKTTGTESDLFVRLDN